MAVDAIVLSLGPILILTSAVFALGLGTLSGTDEDEEEEEEEVQVVPPLVHPPLVAEVTTSLTIVIVPLDVTDVWYLNFSPVFTLSLRPGDRVVPWLCLEELPVEDEEEEGELDDELESW